jgi:hypothetical protein
MNLREHQLFFTRRQLFGRSATGIGTAALASLLNPQLFAAATRGNPRPGVLAETHVPVKASASAILNLDESDTKG